MINKAKKRHDAQANTLEFVRLIALVVCMVVLFANCAPQSHGPRHIQLKKKNDGVVQMNVSGAIAGQPSDTSLNPEATDFLKVNGRRIDLKNQDAHLKIDFTPTEAIQLRKKFDEIGKIPTDNVASVNCSDAQIQAMEDASLLLLENGQIEKYSQANINEKIRTYDHPIEADVIVVCGAVTVETPIRLIADQFILDSAAINIVSNKGGNSIIANEITLIGKSSIKFAKPASGDTTNNVFHVELKPNYYRWEKGNLLLDDSSEDWASLELKTL